MYIVQEIRVGDVDIVRALFERAVLLELQPKKMKVRSSTPCADCMQFCVEYGTLRA